jgi:hypothetical protein
MDDNTFECPNCGARVYPEMSRCPRCGWNMYPEDEEPDIVAREAATPAWGSTMGGFVAGWLITVGIAFLLNSLLDRFEPSTTLTGFGTVVLVLAGPLGALVGGYVGQGVARKSPLLLGSLIGLLALPVLALFTTHWVEVTTSFLLNPWVFLTGVLTILGGAGGSWLNARLTQDTCWREKWRLRGWEDLLYQDLLRRVRFNGSAADRLIEYEHTLDPDAPRFKLIQNAIERWEKDNR